MLLPWAEATLLLIFIALPLNPQQHPCSFSCNDSLHLKLKGYQDRVLLAFTEWVPLYALHYNDVLPRLSIYTGDMGVMLRS